MVIYNYNLQATKHIFKRKYVGEIFKCFFMVLWTSGLQ